MSIGSERWRFVPSKRFKQPFRGDFLSFGGASVI